MLFLRRLTLVLLTAMLLLPSGLSARFCLMELSGAFGGPGCCCIRSAAVASPRHQTDCCSESGRAPASGPRDESVKRDVPPCPMCIAVMTPAGVSMSPGPAVLAPDLGSAVPMLLAIDPIAGPPLSAQRLTAANLARAGPWPAPQSPIPLRI